MLYCICLFLVFLSLSLDDLLIVALAGARVFRRWCHNVSRGNVAGAICHIEKNVISLGLSRRCLEMKSKVFHYLVFSLVGYACLPQTRASTTKNNCQL